MSCCPPGSWPELTSDSDYHDVGQVVTVKNFDLYVVGESNKCVIWNYDIYGFNSGHTRQLADTLAKECGCMVIVPDYYRGTMKDPTSEGLVEFVKEHDWTTLKPVIEGIVFPWAKDKGAKTFGTIGTCWGTYPMLYISGYPEVKAGVAMHPSHSPISDMMGIPEKTLLELAKGTPQLFMPAGNDVANVKPGGLASQVLGSALTIVEFPDMIHGWTTRGDLSDANTNRDVKKAMSEACNFFAKHL